jgi:rfaE bifunctional protein kinase chain/domain
MSFFDDFIQINALVVGDVMLDAYCFGKVERISPEAPVPVVQMLHTQNRLGGAANVALNLRHLGANVQLITVVGSDPAAQILTDLAQAQGIDTQGFVVENHRPTTQKTRIMSGSQQLLRLDTEVKTPIAAVTKTMILQQIHKQLPQTHVVVLEDYDKGVFDAEFIANIIQLCKNHKVICVADPKKDNFAHYQGITLFKPNLKELCEGLNIQPNTIDINTLMQICAAFNKTLNADNILVTLSEKGVFYYKKDGSTGIFAAHLRQISDVSGAGDTVISVAALCLAAGATMAQTAQIANLAGGLVCEQVGVVPINKAHLESEAHRLGLMD